MKKLLTLFSCLAIGGASTATGLANIQLNQSKNNNIPNPVSNLVNYQTYQDWKNEMMKNQNWNMLTNRIPELAGYKFSDISLSLQTVKTSDGKEEDVQSNFYINGPVQMAGAKPESVSQHIIDNSLGNSPMTVSYDSFSTQVQDSVSLSISASLSLGLEVSEKVTIGIPIFAESSTKLKFTAGISVSVGATVSETTTTTQTFDKFSATIDAGKRETINYILMTGREVLNMDAQTKIDTKKSKITFTKGTDKKIYSWDDIINGISGRFTGIGQRFADLIYTNNQHLGYDQSFIGIGTINTPQGATKYNFNDMYSHIEFQMEKDGFTAYIQSQMN